MKHPISQKKRRQRLEDDARREALFYASDEELETKSTDDYWDRVDDAIAEQKEEGLHGER